MQSVVVGVDGSAQSGRAAAWATAEAQRRRTQLHLVLINDDPTRTERSEKAVAALATRCRESAPQLDVREDVVPGHPIEELNRRSEHAQLLVVGSRGHGGFVDALIGSVSAAVAMRASCPVVVVRGDGKADSGPVVVGVDNSRGSETALNFAFDAANQRGTDLVAVQALPDAYFVPGPFPHPDRDELQQQADLHLAEQLAGWAERYPDVSTSKAATNLHPVIALCDAAQDAQLLVVGHRGRGGFAAMLLGSVAHGLLHHAPCPVAVVRTREHQGRQRKDAEQ